MSLPPVLAKRWNTSFLSHDYKGNTSTALIVLNQPFTSWRAFADGGANRVYDIYENDARRSEFLPDLIEGDFDSIREEVKTYYSNKGVNVICNTDQNTTDLQKCLFRLQETESILNEYTVLFLGGLSGRLDQTIHTLSYLHKLRKTRDHVYAITDENVGWVLDAGEHIIDISLERLGPTCGLLPIGIDKTVLSTKGLEWDLTEAESSFDGLISTSNHVVASEVWIKTTKPIWWCVELRSQNRAPDPS